MFSSRRACRDAGAVRAQTEGNGTGQLIDKILCHLRSKGRDARAGSWATGTRYGR
jgi:hypothetical protein